MLDQIIEESIVQRNFIVLPGLGVLVSHHHPADISLGEQKAFPPTKRIAFSDRLSANDVYLRNQLCQKSGLDVIMAEEEVRAFIESIRQKLSQGKNVNIGRLGYLYKNDANDICFEQNTDYNWNLDAYGLAAMPCKPVALKQRHQNQREAVVFELNKGEKINRQKERSFKPTFAKWLPVAAVLFALVLSSILLYVISTSTLPKIQAYESEAAILPLFKPSKALDGESEESKKILERPLSQLSDNFSWEDITNTHASQIESRTPDEKGEPVLKTDNSLNLQAALPFKENNFRKFAVISGSFGLKENAEALQKKCIQKGYEAQIIPAIDKKMYRVAIKSFSSKDSARYFIQKHDDLFEESLWVLSL